MKLLAGFELFFFVTLFGLGNYFIMLRRYKNDQNKRKIIQKNKISLLYPKGTTIRI